MKRFRQNYGQAVGKDPLLFKRGSYEWQRTIYNRGKVCGEALCNPEDVVVSSRCTHSPSESVCSECSIPVCRECWKYAMNYEDIPKALCNDNCVGYLRMFFLENNVTWLESTIACPLFSGLLTCYIEGTQSDRHHLMSEM